jgi:hypothetical protein
MSVLPKLGPLSPVDPKGGPNEFAMSTQGQSDLKRFAEATREYDPAIMVRGALPDNHGRMRENIIEASAWLRELSDHLVETTTPARSNASEPVSLMDKLRLRYDQEQALRPPRHLGEEQGVAAEDPGKDEGELSGAKAVVGLIDSLHRWAKKMQTYVDAPLDPEQAAQSVITLKLVIRILNSLQQRFEKERG